MHTKERVSKSGRVELGIEEINHSSIWFTLRTKRLQMPCYSNLFLIACSGPTFRLVDSTFRVYFREIQLQKFSFQVFFEFWKGHKSDGFMMASSRSTYKLQIGKFSQGSMLFLPNFQARAISSGPLSETPQSRMWSLHMDLLNAPVSIRPDYRKSSASTVYWSRRYYRWYYR